MKMAGGAEVRRVGGSRRMAPARPVGSVPIHQEIPRRGGWACETAISTNIVYPLSQAGTPNSHMHQHGLATEQI